MGVADGGRPNPRISAVATSCTSCFEAFTSLASIHPAKFVGGERGGRDAASGDWWFLATTTPLSLVSPPTTSSRQHVLASPAFVNASTSAPLQRCTPEAEFLKLLLACADSLHATT